MSVTSPEQQAEPKPPKPPPVVLQRRLGRALRSEVLMSAATIGVFAVIIVGVYGAWLGGTFLNAQSRMFDVYQNVPSLLLSVGVIFVLAAGQFDLSGGYMATLAVFLTIGLPAKDHVSLALAIVIALAVGVAGGFINAFLVLVLRLNTFIATLGTGGVFLGLYTLYSSGETVSLSGSAKLAKSTSWFAGTDGLGAFADKANVIVVWLIFALMFSSAWSAVAHRAGPCHRRATLIGGAVAAVVVAVAVAVSGIVGQVSWSVAIFLVLVLVVWVVMRLTPFGRRVYATGGNAAAATLAGIRTARVTTAAFVLSGLFAALAGVVLAADQGTAVPGIADNYLLPAYAAAFLSTVILSDGRFHVWGTVVGGIALVEISQGLVTGGVSFLWTDLINGLVLIVAVSLSMGLRRRAVH